MLAVRVKNGSNLTGDIYLIFQIYVLCHEKAQGLYRPASRGLNKSAAEVLALLFPVLQPE